MDWWVDRWLDGSGVDEKVDGLVGGSLVRW